VAIALLAITVAGCGGSSSPSEKTVSDRCSSTASTLGLPAFSSEGIGITSSRLSAEQARSVLERAKQAIPDWLNKAGSSDLALCYFPATGTTVAAPSTTICPNGEAAEVGTAPPDIVYVVDERMNRVRMPRDFISLLLPGAASLASNPGPCAGLGAP
jgi:hypothetical protein